MASFQSSPWVRLCAAGIVSVSLAGCAVAPARGTKDIDQAIAARGLPAAQWKPSALGADENANKEPLTLERALVLAFNGSPRVQELYAELGIAQADVIEASRISNPRLGYSSLTGDGERQVTRSIAITFTDLLLLPSQSRLAASTFEGSRNRVAASLIELASEVEGAWFEYVSAQQIAQMRRLVSESTNASAEYATRLRDAGNISPRNYSLELAAATVARIASARATSETARARNQLANLIGLRTQDPWQVPKELPAIPETKEAAGDFLAAAEQGRLDLSASRTEVEVAERTLKFLRRWRWLGVIEVGYERETEADGATLKGPDIGWEIPLFNWNQTGILRQEAELEAAKARLAAMELSIRNEVALAANELSTAREVADGYRTALLPQREAVLARTFEEFNYMLTDAFELLQAKREQFEAYEEYLEAVRDYWIARSKLRLLVGGALADDLTGGTTIGVESLIAPPKPVSPSNDHSQHQGHTP